MKRSIVLLALIALVTIASLPSTAEAGPLRRHHRRVVAHRIIHRHAIRKAIRRAHFRHHVVRSERRHLRAESAAPRVNSGRTPARSK